MDILSLFAENDDLEIRSFLDRYPEDIVWYMETYAMNDGSIRRMFDRMSDIGWFDRISGFVFGRELFYEGEGYENVISQCLSDYDVPLVFGADVGHKAPRMVFVNGLCSEFNIRNGKCTIRYRL